MSPCTISVCAWLKLWNFRLRTDHSSCDFLSKKNRSFVLFISAMSSGAGASSGTMNPFGIGSHRGHGFALGHPNFQPGRWSTGAGVTSADVAMGGLPGRHGSGAGPRDRERDRFRGRSTSIVERAAGVRTGSVSGARAQATAFRSAPIGP